jgi:hypothetical protein
LSVHTGNSLSVTGWTLKSSTLELSFNSQTRRVRYNLLQFHCHIFKLLKMISESDESLSYNCYVISDKSKSNSIFLTTNTTDSFLSDFIQSQFWIWQIWTYSGKHFSILHVTENNTFQNKFILSSCTWKECYQTYHMPLLLHRTPSNGNDSEYLIIKFSCTIHSHYIWNVHTRNWIMLVSSSLQPSHYSHLIFLAP